jgi:DUF1365 family protein
VHHQFAYPRFCLLLPLRHLAAQPRWPVAHNRAGWLSFHDRDHGDGGPDALAWLQGLLQQQGVHDADGEVWLQTYPRVAGFVFKPVSFWYCHRADGSLRAVLAEVNNTFGERHAYLLDGPGLRWGATLTARKVMHVSPFCRVQGEYHFRFHRTAQRLVARVELHDAAGTLLVTSLGGHLQPLTPGSARQALLQAPLQAMGVMGRIHWQALRLWAKRVPFFSKPAAPTGFLTR